MKTFAEYLTEKKAICQKGDDVEMNPMLCPKDMHGIAKYFGQNQAGMHLVKTFYKDTPSKVHGIYAVQRDAFKKVAHQ